MSIVTTFGLDGAYSNENKVLYGVECEIESFIHSDVGGVWSAKPDGSLRNGGVEFISEPQPRAETVQAFAWLHKNIGIRRMEERFSPRTSIHVHVNCKNLEHSHVRRMVLLYALFEELFFLQVCPTRRENIHCVALSETHLPSRYGQSIRDMWSGWSKYTALNLKPLSSLGTLEFRHSDGHDDPKRLDDWLLCIENLVTVSKNLDWSPANLTQDNVQLWADQVFGHLQMYPSIRMRLFPLISNSLIDTKLSFN